MDIDRRGDHAFWTKYLDSAPPLLEIITDRPRNAKSARSPEAGRVPVSLPLVGLESLSRETGGASLHTVCLTLWQILLARYSRADDIVVGCSVRSSSGENNLIPVRLELPCSDPADDTPPQEAFVTRLVSKAAAVHDNLLRHVSTPWENLVHELCAEETTSFTPVFQCLFSAPPGRSASTAWSFSTQQPPSSFTVQFDLELYVDSWNGSTRSATGSLWYRKSLFDQLTMERLAFHFQAMCNAVTASNYWYDIPIMPMKERNEVLYDLNNTRAPYPDTHCIHDLFEEQAARNPLHPCIHYQDLSTGIGGRWIAMSYGEAYSRSMAIAQELRRKSVGVGSPVPLLLERSELQIIAIYGVLLAGGCYVPIDVDYPHDRIMHMIQDAGARVVIVHSTTAHKIPPEFQGARVFVDQSMQSVSHVDAMTEGPKRRAELRQDPDSNVYIFYTSGTTGKPKGVEVTHRGLVKRAQWLQDFYPLTPEDRMVYKTPYTFGISEWELFWPLPYGFQIVVCKEGGQKDPEYLTEVTRHKHVTVCTYVPSMLSLLIEYMIGEVLNYTTDMKHVICCGEALPVETCYRFFEVFDPDVTRLHNLYGPTEADMTFWECPKLYPGDPPALTRIPIGKPMLNVKVYILDPRGQPVPAGVPGELHFGGVTTAKGYLGMPELTQQKFILNPYAEPGDCNRMYRTGDCARWLPDRSNIEFLGRVDHQVKLRGFRIELGEIESVLGQCDGVNKAAVIVHGSGASARLVAYTEPATVDVRSLIAHLKTKVPEYMVPAVIMPLPRLPLTSRGKLDRKALPEPPKGAGLAPASKGSDTQFTPPSTPLERIVEAVWRKVLARDAEIDVNTNFLSLGGNSLLAGRATTQIRKETGSMIPSTAMYQHPTIAQIAALCEKFKAKDDGDKGPVIGGNLHKPWGGQPCDTPRVIALHFIGLIFDSFASTAAYLPGFMYIFTVYLEYGKWEALKLLPFVLAGTMVAVVLYTVMAKWLVLGKVQPGEYPVWGGFYMRWWFVHNLHKGSIKLISAFVEDTWIFNKYLTLMGADIGRRVTIGTDDVYDPDMITIEDDVEVSRKATIIPHAIENGILSLWPVHIKHHSRVQPVGWVTQGTVVDAGSIVGPLSTTGMSARDIKKGNTSWRGISPSQNFARTIMVAIIIIFEALAYVPAVYVLEWLWTTGLSGVPDGNMKYCLFYLFFPWVDKLVVGETFFLMTVAFKWLAIGKFKAGRRSHSFYEELSRWTLERLAHNQQFRFATQPWINTELLAVKYRMLGVTMGFKCQTDYLELLEYDLLTVGADSVFGSNVTICCSDHIESRRVVMQPSAQVLDHSTLMPGCVVGRGALCGSSTVGSKFYKFPPLSISTGNQGGRPVQLRVLQGDPNSTANLSHLPPAEKDMALQALRNHQNNWSWGCFNLFNIISVMIIAPLPAFADLLTVLLWVYLDELSIFQEGDAWTSAVSWGLTVLITPPVYLLVQMVEALLFIVFKWMVVGRYKEGNFPFYGAYHRKWVIMMAVKEAIGKLLDEISGTVFTTWFFRAMGSHIGKDVCIMGYGLEYDLFSAGDYCSVGTKCDVTCHTVENMVIKLAPTKLHTKCTMRAGALVQPGGVVLDGAVIQENSQVLKGGEVGQDQVYAGLPAEPIQRVMPELAHIRVTADDMTPDETYSPAGISKPASGYSSPRVYFLLVLFLFGLWSFPRMWAAPDGHTPSDTAAMPKVKTAEGVLRGLYLDTDWWTGSARVFNGIPYAVPPLDDRRWQPPQPVEHWTGVRTASDRQPGCIDGKGEGSEDCLYLDITAPVPTSADAALFPVIFWVHGGCLTWSGSDPGYNGKAILRAMGDVIIVTANYRLGPLGFLHGAGVNTSANLGLQDQRAALKWVKRNIRAFHGDPERVTLFGQGSGSASVAAHLVMPESWGLFSRAIMQNSPLSSYVARSPAASHAIYERVARAVGCDAESPEVMMDCLKVARAADLALSGMRAVQCQKGNAMCKGSAWPNCGDQACVWAPVIDGRDLTDHPWKLIEEGRHAKVPIIMGYRLHDGMRSIDVHHPFTPNATASDWKAWVEASFANDPAAVEREYDPESFRPKLKEVSARSEYWLAGVAARTDLVYGCTVKRMAGALAKSTSVYVYVYDLDTVDSTSESAVLSHLWFHQWSRSPKSASIFDRAVVGQAVAYWSAFVRDGDPNSHTEKSDGMETWPVLSNSEQVLMLHVPAAAASYPMGDKCSFWSDHWTGTVTCEATMVAPPAPTTSPPTPSPPTPAPMDHKDDENIA